MPISDPTDAECESHLDPQNEESFQCNTSTTTINIIDSVGLLLEDKGDATGFFILFECPPLWVVHHYGFVLHLAKKET